MPLLPRKVASCIAPVWPVRHAPRKSLARSHNPIGLQKQTTASSLRRPNASRLDWREKTEIWRALTSGGSLHRLTVFPTAGRNVTGKGQ
jgi:hypothetical protein